MLECADDSSQIAEKPLAHIAKNERVFEESRFDPERCRLYLKICPLCGAVLVRSEARCCKCAWPGPFRSSPEELRAALKAIYGPPSDSAAVELPGSPEQ
ncbi:MAG: hypothetical protein C4341_06125 [Armatimonadota bacterium]